jgi:DNA-binding NarL/FixJ family response regulator
VADDHQGMRFATWELMKDYAAVRLVTGASNFREVIDRTSEVQPDVVLMDMPAL